MILDPKNTSASIALDPADSSSIKRFRSAKPLDPNFHFFPDIRVLRPGDLILTGPAEKPGFLDRRIISYQNKRSHGGTQWTHAAIYLYDQMIVEARPFRNTRQNYIGRFVPSCRILVLRPKQVAIEDMHRSYTRGLRLALEAALLIGDSKYGIWSIINSVAPSYIKDMVNIASSFGPISRTPRFVCSGLYASAHRNVFNEVIVGNDISKGGPITPSMLATSDAFVRVDVPWVNLLSIDWHKIK